MGGINVRRWLLGGLAAGGVVFLIEGLASSLYIEDLRRVMEGTNLPVEMSAGGIVHAALVSLLVGMVAVFFYAAARPRFGPGPKTALIIAFVLFFGSFLVSILGIRMIGLFPDDMLFLWAAIGFFELMISTLVGAWIYRED